MGLVVGAAVGLLDGSVLGTAAGAAGGDVGEHATTTTSPSTTAIKDGFTERFVGADMAAGNPERPGPLPYQGSGQYHTRPHEGIVGAICYAGGKDQRHRAAR